MIKPHDSVDPVILKAQLLGSLIVFTQIFYYERTGREFILSTPIGRESHYITICRELTKVFNLETLSLLINVPPGHAKSELLIHFIAWAMAHYPDSRFLYISYSHELASAHTYTIKQLMELPLYRKLFGVSIKYDSSAKDNFQTTQGGAVKAFGSLGSITGHDAGLPNVDRFSGVPVMDDMHKPDEVFSDTKRETVKRNYKSTIDMRLRSPNVPIVGIGQCLHEDDLFMNLRNDFDGRKWTKIILPAEDDAGNILAPNILSREMIERKKKYSPYEYWAQLQQNPQPSGGGIFRVDDFYLMDDEPKILQTIITIDTAETSKDYNDATVMSFWGLYKIEDDFIESDLWGLHWIDCREIWVEPKDLESEFRDFYAGCMRYKIKPNLVAVEKKSTGVTLLSVLSAIRGLKTMNIERTAASGSKTARFLSIQPIVSRKQISLPRYGKHTRMCIEHCSKITNNNTHKRDDIADSMYDAIKIALIDKTLHSFIENTALLREEKAKKVMQKYQNYQRVKRNGYK